MVNKTIYVLHFIKAQNEEEKRNRTRISSTKITFDLYKNCQFLTHDYKILLLNNNCM